MDFNLVFKTLSYVHEYSCDLCARIRISNYVYIVYNFSCCAEYGRIKKIDMLKSVEEYINFLNAIKI